MNFVVKFKTLNGDQPVLVMSAASNEKLASEINHAIVSKMMITSVKSDGRIGAVNGAWVTSYEMERQ
jgi:hypothetical protein